LHTTHQIIGGATKHKARTFQIYFTGALLEARMRWRVLVILYLKYKFQRLPWKSDFLNIIVYRMRLSGTYLCEEFKGFDVVETDIVWVKTNHIFIVIFN
jgi:hypothetical protein